MNNVIEPKFKTGDAVLFNSKSHPELNGQYEIDAVWLAKPEEGYLTESNQKLYVGYVYHMVVTPQDDNFWVVESSLSEV